MTPTFEIEVITLTILMAISCSLIGAVITFKDDYIIAEASSKSSILGMAFGFALFSNISSTFFLPIAIFFGLLGIYLSNYLTERKIFPNKIGLFVIPSILFAFCLVIVSLFANVPNVDINIIFNGDLASIPFERLIINGKDYGVIYIYLLIVLLIFNIVVIILYYKQIKIISIDTDFAKSIKLPISKIYTIISIMVTITVASSFRITGAIMVVAFILAPPLTANLYSKRLSVIITLSILISVISSLISFSLAAKFNILISGTVAVILGIIFIISAFIAPEKGIIPIIIKNKKAKIDFDLKVVTVFLFQNKENISKNDLYKKMSWKKHYSEKIIVDLINKDLIFEENNLLFLTDNGKKLANNLLQN